MHAFSYAVGPYDVGPLLGKGAQGHTHLGRHRGSTLLVALKFIPHRHLDEKRRRLLLDEIFVALRLGYGEHRTNLIDFIECTNGPTEKGAGFEPCALLVLELAPRGELMEYLLCPSGAFQEDLARAYAYQLLRSLDELHVAGVAHRDVKPENLLLDAAYRLKLSDFGLACITQDNQGTSLPLTAHVGTRNYMAPELLLGRGYYGPAVDAWAAGVVIFILATGRQPYRSPSRDDTLFASVLLGRWDLFWVPHEAAAMQRGGSPTAAACSPAFRDFAQGLLCADPSRRLHVKAALAHPWITGDGGATQPHPASAAAFASDASVAVAMDARRRRIVTSDRVRYPPPLPPLMFVDHLDTAAFGTAGALKALLRTEGAREGAVKFTPIDTLGARPAALAVSPPQSAHGSYGASTPSGGTIGSDAGSVPGTPTESMSASGRDSASGFAGAPPLDRSAGAMSIEASEPSQLHQQQPLDGLVTMQRDAGYTMLEGAVSDAAPAVTSDAALGATTSAAPLAAPPGIMATARAAAALPPEQRRAALRPLLRMSAVRRPAPPAAAEPTAAASSGSPPPSPAAAAEVVSESRASARVYSQSASMLTRSAPVLTESASMTTVNESAPSRARRRVPHVETPPQGSLAAPAPLSQRDLAALLQGSGDDIADGYDTGPLGDPMLPPVFEWRGRRVGELEA